MEIKISKCTAGCHGCDADFAHQQEVHSVVIREENSLKRHDYCLACSTQAQGRELFSAWTTHYLDPAALDLEEQEGFSPLRRLFYDTALSQERIELAQAYLAAQLLRRQKVFRRIKESDDADGGERLTLFLDRIGNRLIEARDLNFSYAELDAARIVLMERLQAIEAPPPEQATDESATAEAAPEQSDQGISHAQTAT